MRQHVAINAFVSKMKASMIKSAIGLVAALTTLDALAVLAEIEDVRVAPLIKTRWAQSYWGGKTSAGMVFNKDTPGNGVCGCGVTASAQLMRYHAYPDFPLESMSNDCVYHDQSATYAREVLHLTTKGGVYEWSKMPYRYDTHPELDDVERNAIAKLTSDLGISFGVSYMYRDRETNTDKETLVANFKRIWKYGSGYYIWLTVPQGEDLPGWALQAIFGSLNAKRPVIVWCKSPDDGHTFLLDGYGYHKGRPYLHANCGWSGKSDGWYAFMEDIVSDLATLRYIAFNIHPSQPGQILSGRVTDGEGRPIFGATVTAIDESDKSMRSTETDERGIYSFVVNRASSFQVTAEKDGVRAIQLAIQMVLPTTVASDDTHSKIQLANVQTIGNRFDVDFSLAIPLTQRRYDIQFDLGRYGRHVGGGALTQAVLHAARPATPQFGAAEGWRFVGWDSAIENATCDRVYKARFVDADGDPSPDCYVDIHASPGGDGLTPETALTSLKNGLCLAPAGGVAYVAAGVYPPLKYTDNKVVLAKSSSGKLQTAIDGGGTNRVVQLGTNNVVSVNTVLRGFTIRNGYCTAFGAGGYAGTYIDCDFINNVTTSSGAAAYGASLISCRVLNNSAGGNGGGVRQCSVTNSVLANNIANTGGGAYDCILTDCLVVSNSAVYAGGLSRGRASRTRILDNVSTQVGGGAHKSCLADSLIVGNRAETSGGGCYECTNVNCTVYGNHAVNRGGGAYGGIYTNCIVWGNTSGNGYADFRTSETCGYCLSGTALAGVGNRTGDPKMNVADKGDFRLRSDSPCLNAGLNEAVAGTEDALGHSRIQDGVVDIGACEGVAQTTLMTPVEVPYAWLDQYPALVKSVEGDYEKAAKLKTGKGFNSAGQELCVWHDYLVGTDPTDRDDKFRITDFKVTDGKIEIAWEPDLNEKNTKSVRTYRIKGSNDLQEWYDTDEATPLFKFFKVVVEVANARKRFEISPL